MKLLASLLVILFSGINASAQIADDIEFITLDSFKNGGKFLKDWRFTPSDDSNYALPSYDQSSWEIVDPKFDFLTQTKLATTLKSVVWFRKYIHVDSSLSTVPIALKMNHFGASDIYIDGRRVIRYGQINSTDKIRYECPSTPLLINLSPGTHLVAVRYANYNFQKNHDKYREFYTGFELSINRADQATESLHTTNKFKSVLTIFFFAFFLAFFLSHLLVFIHNRKEKANFYFSVFCFGLSFIFFWLFLTVASSNPVPHLSLVSVVFITTAVMSVALSGFLNTLFGSFKLRFKILFITGIASIVVWFTYHNAYLIGALIILVCLEAIVLIVRALFRKMSGAGVIGIGLLIFTSCIFIIVFDAVYTNNDINIGNNMSITLLLTMLSLPVSMSIYLSRNYASINKNLKKQLVQVEALSEKTIQQELEKQQLLENRKEELEKEVEVRTSELSLQKQKSDDLLLNILPEEVAEELKEKGTSAAKYFDHVSVLFTDFVDFTKAGERLTPQQLVDELHTCFKKFDEICSKYNIEKIKTIGDAYLAVSGLPMADEEHAINITKAAIEIREFIRQRKEEMPETSFNIRIGIHSGSVVAGIVGVKKFAYDIWGDTVNTAARMEQSSELGKINISQFTYELVKDKFVCTYRGKITAKNKGELNMYFVEGESR